MSYLKALNIEQAVALLRGNPGRIRVVGGATDLFLQEMPQVALDITALPETTGLETAGDLFSLGAALTHSEVANSYPVRQKATALTEACASIGSPQIRNIGTLGGNVINAAPAADAAVALVALGAGAVMINLERETREEAVEDLYAGFNQTVIDSGSEIMLKLVIRPCAVNEGSSFERFASRKALALPMVNGAARVEVVDGFFRSVRLVLAPINPAPTRLLNVEGILQGAPVTEETYKKIETEAAAEVEVRTSLLRCTAQYRSHLIGVLAARVVRKAADRALERK